MSDGRCMDDYKIQSIDSLGNDSQQQSSWQVIPTSSPVVESTHTYRNIMIPTPEVLEQVDTFIGSGSQDACVAITELHMGVFGAV